MAAPLTHAEAYAAAGKAGVNAPVYRAWLAADNLVWAARIARIAAESTPR